MIDFAGKRWWTLSISLALFLVSAGALALFGLRPGIEFTSGSSFTFEFQQPVRQDELRSALHTLGYGEARVQGAGTNIYLIRTRELENSPALGATEGPVPPGELDTIQASLEEQFGPITRSDFATVSGTVSTEIAWYATIAVILAALAILLYISFAFRRVPKPFRYGTCAVIARLTMTAACRTGVGTSTLIEARTESVRRGAASINRRAADAPAATLSDRAT